MDDSGRSLEVDGVAGFVRAVLSTHEEWTRAGLTADLWFRGLGSAAHPLLPTAYRDDGCDEQQQFVEFKSLALSLADPRPQDDWEWYFLARHHGLPTRLLDWTENALGALFRAVDDDRESSDDVRCVWLLNPCALNAWASDGRMKAQVVAPLSGKIFDEWLPDRCRRGSAAPLAAGSEMKDNARPIAVYPRRIGSRMIAQQAMFTLHGSDPRPLEAMVGSMSGLRRIDIPASRREAVRRELDVLGLAHASWFPDLDGIARTIRAKYGARR